MSSEEEVVAEVEAVEAMYGDDCVFLQHLPPHLHLRIKPRTAVPTPVISVINSKGLHDMMHDQLVSSIKDKAVELSSCMMLVVLCEEAVETLSSMNYPDGDCPMCLCPLYGEDDGSPSMPFMKLMSCFHCFHRFGSFLVKRGGNVKVSGTCPVCRKVFFAKDLEHMLGIGGAHPDSTHMIRGEESLNTAMVPSGSSNTKMPSTSRYSHSPARRQS